jgi:peptide/nickel transport system substrate-binding protein
MNKHSILGGLTIAVLAAVSVTACSSSSGSGSSKGGGTFTSVDELTPITSGAPMNPWNQSYNTFVGYDTMQLAWPAYSASDPSECLPGLASSWSLSSDGSTLTVHLQPGAKWSNGQPVTADDVKTSTAIWFTQDVAQAYNLGAVNVVNPSTVQFVQTAGAHNNQFASGLLCQATNNFIVPTSVYGSQLPSDIWTTIGASLGTGAAATTASTTLTQVGKTLQSFAPATDVSAGPFTIKAINPGEAVLVKNKYFYNASKVGPSEVVMLHYSGNSQIWSYMQSGKLDAAPYTAMPTNVLDEVSSSGNQRVDSPSFVAVSLAFDQSVAPYSNRAVRQALAYVINRQAVQKVGEPVSGLASTTTTGVISSILGSYLTSQQQSALNPYATNTATATSLLKGAGFTQKSGQWYLPGGKPWTITLNTPNGFSDWLEGASVIKSELTSFGIPTSISQAPDYATYLTNLYKGSYPVAFWLMALGPQGYNAYQRIYGTYDGWIAVGNTLKRFPTGSTTADNFLNTTPTVSVPGIGTVNPAQLTYQLSQMNLSSPAGLAQQKSLMAQLIATTNYDVPVIQLWDYVNVQFVSSKRFTDWPTGDNALLNNSPGVWMANGYVQAK